MEQLTIVEVRQNLWAALAATRPPLRPWKLHLPGSRDRSYTTRHRAIEAADRLRKSGHLVDGPELHIST